MTPTLADLSPMACSSEDGMDVPEVELKCYALA
jgi:hypothetical protein